MENLVFFQLQDPETSTYTYVLADAVSREGIVIDSVKEQAERDAALLERENIQPLFFLETHVHADHVTGASALRNRFGGKIAISADSGAEGADLYLREGDVISFGRFQLQALRTPGHTDGCMSFYGLGRVFTGDALMIGDVGRTDFQQGSPEVLYQSLHRAILSLPVDTVVFPGHDYGGRTSSTIAQELNSNAKVGGNASLEEFQKRVAATKLGLPKKIHIAVPANLKCGRD